MRATATTLLLTTAALAGCLLNEEIDLDGVGDAGAADTEEPVQLSLDGGIDLLLVVDDSISMAQEQEMLETSVFHLVNSLAHPFVQDINFPVDDVRVAVVSTNMGFSADGESGDVYWPGDMVAACQGFGDDGEFRISSAADVVIESDAIPCSDPALHCPPGWGCAFGESCFGQCEPPTPGQTELQCPGDGASYAETTPAAPNEDLALEVACLTSLGTGGCGFEQQLASAVRATAREDQKWFFREKAALGVLVVSDEDDCSMDDMEELFGTEEVSEQGAMKINIACGSHSELLRQPKDILDDLSRIKGGVEEAVFFAAIVGVPLGTACEGKGDAIGGCLLQPEMQLVPEQPDGTTWFYHPACARGEGDVEVTRAYPGRRFVQLAREFGDRGYVFSICNDDWMPAMAQFATNISAAMQ
jgi:hypothetical protein